MPQQPPKPDLSFLPPHAMLEIGKVVVAGNQKYAPWDWLKAYDSPQELIAKTLRHIMEYEAGRDTDPDTGAHVLANAITDLIYALQLALMGKDGRADWGKYENAVESPDKIP